MNHSTFRRVRVGVVGLALFVGPDLVAQAGHAGESLPRIVRGPIASRIHRYLSASAAFGFSGQVLVARDGEVILHAPYGYADRSRRRLIELTTPIGIASTSKQFAASAVLKLVEDRRLSLDDSLGRFFPDAPADKRGITLRMLLTHTAAIRGGFTEDFDVPSLDSGVARLLNAPLRGEPGKAWRYSSDAYNLVAAIVQKVAGMPYERFVHQTLFHPAGMRHSRFWGEMRGDTTVAHAYAGWVDRGSPAEWPRNWRVFGSGDVVSTASDLWAWSRAVRDGRVLRPSTVALAHTAHARIEAGTGYGYGIFVTDSSRGGRLLEHGGDTELGYNAAFFLYPERDAALIILSNSRDARGISLRQYVQAEAEAMMFGGDSVADAPMAEMLSREALTRMAGSYVVAADDRLQLITDGAYLWAAGDGQSALQRLGVTPARDSLLAVANERTARLLDGLLARDLSAFDTALTAAGRAVRGEYVDEWTGLVRANGPLHRYRVIGSVQPRAAVVTYARLYFLNGDITMSFAWADSGRGRLAGTDARAPAFPAVFPVARLSDGRLIAHDAFRGQTMATIEVRQDGTLRLTRHGGQPRILGSARRDGWAPH